MTYEDIQSDYLEEMRRIIPDVLAWWDLNAAGPPESLDERPPQNAFERRWPLGPVGHPRVLHVVRTYYLKVRDLNEQNELMRPDDTREARERDWGTDDDMDDVEFQLPIDVLVQDIEDVAPEVYRVVSGLVFVPVGLSPEGEYC